MAEHLIPTGHYRHRRTWLGKLVLQVEMKSPSRTIQGIARIFESFSWRDAKVTDLPAPKRDEVSR